MTYMEKPSSGKVLLDDTVPLTAVIEASQNAQSHTEYIIRVQRGVSPENSWQVTRRYSDFDLLNNSLMVCGIGLLLPPKKLIGNMDREFIAERQRGLQAYLDSVTQHPLLSCSLPVKKFLDPNSYSANYTEIALQQVSMFFRSDLKWEVLEPLRDMGWRIRKKYFLVKNKEQPKERYLLSWVDLGPHKFLSDKDLQSAMKWLSGISVPYLCPLLFFSLSESSALLIRPFSEKGSLRDHICKVKPKECYLKKYCNPKKREGLELQDIKKYGRQILEGLKALHDAGMFFGHLHASNVIVDDGVCRLVDVENGVLGVPSFLRAAFTQHRKINSTEAVDVFGFGHLLYEMTYGQPPDAVPIDHAPAVPYAAVVPVLESILSTEACKMTDPFGRCLWVEAARERLGSPCLQIHQHRRLTRAQSHHGSDEERTRRKILARKKSRRTACETEEDVSARNNNSGTLLSVSPVGARSDPPPAPLVDASSSCPPPPPPPPPPLASPDGAGGGRNALLNSIQTFRKGKLKKTETTDRSNPVV
uniref:PX domain containing serine/threonine kinase n=1 Tax=Takifugu rubripes TaxID=31033 RepID=H2RZK6_TAKRU